MSQTVQTNTLSEVADFIQIQMSNEIRAPGWLGYIGDEIPPS